MASEEHIKILQSGIENWNSWRNENPGLSPSLRDITFSDKFPNPKEIYNLPNFENCNFSNTDLHGVSLRNGFYTRCNFNGSQINFADLVDAYFESCTFNEVRMRVTKIGSASFHNCSFIDSDLSYCSAQDTSFSGSTFKNTKLEHISFINNDFSDSTIQGCFVYGISSWDLSLENAEQKDLIITNEDQPQIKVDNIELAQFLYLIINNKKLRDVIDTITSKVVLILGNFSPDRKAILDEIRDILRKSDFIPVMFDFKKPASRNLTETVMTLANMSKFVIADLTSPRSIGHELSAVIPRLQSVNFYPIINQNETEYGMFEEFAKLQWVKPIKEYDSVKKMVALILKDEM
ncbi:pentapeptide repeat-containing protein [Spirochaeta dissipatitropha]